MEVRFVWASKTCPNGRQQLFYLSGRCEPERTDEESIRSVFLSPSPPSLACLSPTRGRSGERQAIRLRFWIE